MDVTRIVRSGIPNDEIRRSQWQVSKFPYVKIRIFEARHEPYYLFPAFS